jgi:hypothetical protein
MGKISSLDGSNPQGAASDPSGGRLSRANIRAMWLISAALFAVSLVLFTAGNSFPYYYHPDEPLEVQLVTNGETNFHHPLLMGNVTDLVSRLLGNPRTPQHIVVVGRWCVAVFGAIAVVALAWLAFYFGGLLAGIVTGFLVSINPLLVENAHFYKEDTALLMGLALSFLAIAMFWENPSWKLAVFLGVASALAVSGKYVGIIAMLLSVVTVFLAPGKAPRVRHLLVFLGVFVASILLVNYQVFWGQHVFSSGVNRELEFLWAGGNAGLSQAIPHKRYFDLLIERTNVFFGFFIAWRVIQMFRNPRVHPLPEWLFAAFPFVFTLVLAFTPKMAARYFLPAGAMCCYLAGLGVSDFCQFIHPRLRRWRWGSHFVVIPVCILAVSWAFLFRTVSVLQGFQSDSRKNLAVWIRANIAPDAIIAEDSRVALAPLNEKEMKDRAVVLDQTVISERYVADLGPLSLLSQRSVSYVAVYASEQSDLRPTAAVRGSYQRRKAFYKELAQNGSLVWRSEPGAPLTLRPELLLYRLADLRSQLVPKSSAPPVQ